MLFLEEERFIAGVRATVAKYGMLARGDLVVVGVSGGPDSLALLYALYALKDDLGIAMHVAHLNHRLRRAAAEDARFVASAAAGLGLPCTVEVVDVRAARRRSGLSLEHAARRERYLFFERVAAAAGAGNVATAHTADDNVETVLINLLRGAGPDGMAGIPPVRPMRRIFPSALVEEPLAGELDNSGKDAAVRVVRPLIETWRSEVEAYCRAMGLSPRRDISNRSRAFLRNRVRLDLLPYLRKHFGEDIAANLQRLSQMVRPEADLLERMAVEAISQLATPVDGGASASTSALREMPVGLQRRVVRALLRRVKGSPEEIGFREIERVLEAAAQEGETAFDLPGPVRVRRQGDRLMLQPRRGEEPEEFAGGPLPVPGLAPAPGGTAITAEALEMPAEFAVPRVHRARDAFLDADAMFFPLAVRAWRPGDRFVPLGMTGRKSLHRLFIDEKIPIAERARRPVVTDARGIVWVAGVAIADRVKITGRTRRLLYLRWEEKP